jgi:hypothetical protein
VLCIQSYNAVPSPRPSGSGAWKILLFPKHLHDGIFCFVIFIGYIFEPIICFLLWVPGVRYHTCDLFVFVGFCLASLACTLVWLPLPLLLRLSAVPDHMSWFLTTITYDFSFVSRLSFPSVILHTWFCLFLGSCEPSPCSSWGCIHGIWIPRCLCDPSPLLLWLWSRGTEVVNSVFQMDILFLCFERLVAPLFVRLWVFVGVYEVIHFAG